MRYSLHLARIAGIDVKVHATFFLLLAYFAFVFHREGGPAAAVEGVLFVLLVFLCVLLHEFGHALAARRYGIRTPDITLLPIGGLARLERIPENPVQELVIAIAGPAVNVAIAAGLWAFLGVTNAIPHPTMIEHVGVSLPVKLLAVNITLIVFNLIPAFPMDGGRVLRAVLAMRMDYARATNIAATIGQGCAFLLGAWGLLHTPPNPMLVLIAVFVFLGAGQEAALAQLKSASVGLHVSSAMVTQFRALPRHATLNEAIDALLQTSQHDFPVVSESGAVCGILTRDDLIVALRKSGAGTPVAEIMRVNVPTVHPSMPFARAFTMIQESACPALPVVDSAGRLVGLFTPENVGELMMVQSALAKAPGGRASRVPPLPAA
jgi:Zn-dependent protease/predicted transcriptional regulator